MENVDVWYLFKIQCLVISIVSYLMYRVCSFFFFTFINDEEKESIEKDLGKPIRSVVIFFYINTLFMKTTAMMTFATFLAIILKDWLWLSSLLVCFYYSQM